MVVLPSPPGVNHGAGLLHLGEGRLVACWYSGRSEGGSDAVILCSRSRDGGDGWTPPEPVSRPGERAGGAARPAKSVGNVALARDARGRVVMIVGEIQSRRIAGVETCRNWRCGRIDFRVSKDDGASWSRPTRLDDRPGALPRGRPVRFEGADRIPVYQEAGRAGVLRVELSRLEPGQAPGAGVEPIAAPGPLIQPALADAGGRLVALLRDPRRRFVHVSLWEKGGWTPATPTDLENPDSAVEAFADARGRLIAIYNPGRADRRTLRLAASTDGTRFAQGCDIVPKDAAGDAAYPAVAQTGPRSWGLVFSIQGKRRIAFMRLDQAFLDACLPEP